MSYVISGIDYTKLPTDMLDAAKRHMRVTFTTDDESIKDYLKWAIAYVEVELGWQIASVNVAWSPLLSANTSRLPFPLQPVASFKVMQGAADISDQFSMAGASPVEPVWLVHNDGTAFPADAAITFVAGFAAANTIPPNVEASIFRIAATLYENRESVSDLSLENVPGWMRDLLDGAWIPRA